jgi:hypothetical protein
MRDPDALREGHPVRVAPRGADEGGSRRACSGKERVEILTSVSQYYLLKGRSSPWTDEDVLWNPAQRVSQIYMGYVQVLERVLSMESGLVDLHVDEIEVDPDRLAAFARRLLEELVRTNHDVFAAQIRAVLGPAVVMADRAGRPLKPIIPREGELLAEARVFRTLPR